jgi:hypothetical protein
VKGNTSFETKLPDRFPDVVEADRSALAAAASPAEA